MTHSKIKILLNKSNKKKILWKKKQNPNPKPPEDRKDPKPKILDPKTPNLNLKILKNPKTPNLNLKILKKPNLPNLKRKIKIRRSLYKKENDLSMN